MQTVRFALCHESYKNSSSYTKGSVADLLPYTLFFTIYIVGLLSYYKGSPVKRALLMSSNDRLAD